MKNGLNGFDAVANTYDFLARLIFGNSLRQSQFHFLSRIPNGSNVLILGGGSGEILMELRRQKPSCKICYVEASEKMMILTKAKVQTANAIQFIHGTERSIPADRTFDAVITNFYLDLFSNTSLTNIIKLIKSSLASNGIWLVSDFVRTNKTWQRILLTTMYKFFRVVAGIEASALPDWTDKLREAGLQESESLTFFKGFIKSAVFREGEMKKL